MYAAIILYLYSANSFGMWQSEHTFLPSSLDSFCRLGNGAYVPVFF